MQHEKYTYSPYQLNSLAKWKAYLAMHEELLRKRFRAIITRYTRENWVNLPSEEQEIVELEFFHGSGELSFSFSARSLDGHEIDKISDGQLLVPEFDWTQPQGNDFIYPESLDVYYEEFRENRAEREKWSLTFDWLIRNWIELGGHKIGILCGTFQNNAATIFSLNLINWDDFINTPEAQLNQLVNYPLNRDLTPFEIQSRVRFSRYQPFLQKFRYFEKDEVFFEIGYYANLIGTRTGAKLGYSTLPFDVRVFPYEYRSMRFDQYGHIAEKVDQITNDGFEEKPKPTVGVKLMAELVEWEYGPFIGAFEPITAAAYDQFRNTLGFEVPKQYHWFIERMNKVKPEREIANFRITPGQWKTFEVFYEFEDLVHQYKQFHSAKGTKGELLPIARDTEGGHVLVDAINGTVYYHQNELIKTHSSFQELLTGCTNISSYFKPMRYHLEKDNTAMLRQWLSAGVDVNDEALFGGRKALRITRNREIVELLCQHGADPNDIFLFSEMGSDYVKMLVHHGLNLKAKLEAQLWFKREIMTNDEYKEFRDLVEE